MPTEIQRVQAICNAIVNGTATQAQMDRLGQAAAISLGRLSEYQAGTNTQKARITLDWIRADCINTIKSTEASAAATAAANAAAASADGALPESP